MAAAAAEVAAAGAVAFEVAAAAGLLAAEVAPAAVPAEVAAGAVAAGLVAAGLVAGSLSARLALVAPVAACPGERVAGAESLAIRRASGYESCSFCVKYALAEQQV